MKDDQYILLIQKQLTGDITPHEQSLLDGWLASADNQRVAKRIQKAWTLSEGFSQDVDLDLEADFQKIENKLGGHWQQEAKIRTLIPRRVLLRVAAVILLLIIGRFAWENFVATDVVYALATTTDQPSDAPIELLDGSKVWLNAETKLTYFTTPVKNERRVKMEGEAFFEVAKDASKPFVVETPSGEVTVLGTSFNVSEKTVGHVAVAVATGKVELSPKGSDSAIILLPNEKGIYNADNSELIREDSKNLNELAWRTKKLVFDNTTLSSAISTIQDFYHVSIQIENKDLENCPLTATFDNKPIGTVLETLTTLLGAESEQLATGEYVLKGGKCQK
jgi:ferric-dicitrate binding protein FerR (iron transport regulator)